MLEAGRDAPLYPAIPFKFWIAGDVSTYLSKSEVEHTYESVSVISRFIPAALAKL